MLTAGELYGKGIFTTVAIHDGRPILWEKHWQRIFTNAATLDIDLSEHTESQTQASLLRAITESGLRDGRARITFSDVSASSIWPRVGEMKTSVSTMVAGRRPIQHTFKVTISPHRINTTSPLSGIKSCNYLEHLLAYEKATKGGFHEAIRLNERGEVASACMANVFWQKDGTLFTPSLPAGCLPGTTREFVLENLDCEQVEAGLDDLASADRIFLTSAGIGAVPVAEFNGQPLDTSAHRLTELISWAV